MKHKDVVSLMGRVVLVEKVLVRDSRDRKRIWRERAFHKPRPGWIVGCRHLQNGQVEYVSNGFDDYATSAYFVCKETVPCLLVSYWPNTKPVKVPLDGYSETDQKPYMTTYQFTEKDREYLRKEMAEVPRDEKGRWK